MRARSAKVLAVVPDDQLAFRDLVECAQSGLDVHAMRDGEPIARKVDELSASRLPSAEGRLLVYLGQCAPTDLWFLLGAAALLGRRRVDAVDLANAVGMSDRAVRRHLAAAGMVTPGHLPAYCTGAYLAADFQLRGITVHAVAHNRGFDDTTHLRRYLVARTGASPTTWAALGAEGAVLYAGSGIRKAGENREVTGEKPIVRGENRYDSQSG